MWVHSRSGHSTGSLYLQVYFSSYYTCLLAVAQIIATKTNDKYKQLGLAPNFGFISLPVDLFLNSRISGMHRFDKEINKLYALLFSFTNFTSSSAFPQAHFGLL